MVDWLVWDEDESEFESEAEDCDVLLYSLSFTAVPFFWTQAVTSELTVPPPPGPPPMPPPPIWT